MVLSAILSFPIQKGVPFYSAYTDGLLQKLQKSKICCLIADVCWLTYANAVSLLAPTCSYSDATSVENM